MEEAFLTRGIEGLFKDNGSMFSQFLGMFGIKSRQFIASMEGVCCPGISASHKAEATKQCKMRETVAIYLQQSGQTLSPAVCVFLRERMSVSVSCCHAGQLRADACFKTYSYPPLQQLRVPS